MRRFVPVHEGELEPLPACEDCPIGGRDQPGRKVCPHVHACDEEAARLVETFNTACGLARRFMSIDGEA